MPSTLPRPSLDTDLAARYQNQRVGSAFNVKETLESITPGRVIDADSLQGRNFQSPSGFEVKSGATGTQLKEAQGSVSQQLSRYMQGFSNRRYKGRLS